MSQIEYSWARASDEDSTIRFQPARPPRGGPADVFLLIGFSSRYYIRKNRAILRYFKLPPSYSMKSPFLVGCSSTTSRNISSADRLQTQSCDRLTLQGYMFSSQESVKRFWVFYPYVTNLLISEELPKLLMISGRSTEQQIVDINCQQQFKFRHIKGRWMHINGFTTASPDGCSEVGLPVGT